MAELFERTPQNITMHIMKVNWKKSQPVRNTYKFKLKVKEGLSVFKNIMTWMSLSPLVIAFIVNVVLSSS